MSKQITHDEAEHAVHRLTGATSGDGPIEYYKLLKSYIAQQRSLATVSPAAVSEEAVEKVREALRAIATDPPVSETPTIESILDRAQRIARAALALLPKSAKGKA